MSGPYFNIDACGDVGLTGSDGITELLPKLQNYGNISPESLDSLVERIKEDMKRKEILDKHKPVIKQLSSGRWYTRIDGKRVERTDRKVLEDVVYKYYTKPKDTINTIYPSFIECRKFEVKPTTWEKDMLYYDMYIKDSPISDIPIERLGIDDGYRFLKHCFKIKPEMKKMYWRNLIGCLNQMMKYAINRNMIIRNPFEHLKPDSDLFAPETKTRDGDSVFTREEQRKVCKLAGDDADATISSIPLGILLLFNLGLRDGELCALKWGDIEDGMKGQYIHIQREMVANVNEDGNTCGVRILPHCKTKAGDRRLQISNTVSHIFDRIKTCNSNNGLPVGNDDFVFLRVRKGQIDNCTSRCFDARLRKYCRQAGMEVIKSPHDIRRTVLTNLYMMGMPLKKIQVFAGHSSVQQTMDYIRISDDNDDVIAYLDKLSEIRQEGNIVRFRKKA